MSLFVIYSGRFSFWISTRSWQQQLWQFVKLMRKGDVDWKRWPFVAERLNNFFSGGISSCNTEALGVVVWPPLKVLTEMTLYMLFIYLLIYSGLLYWACFSARASQSTCEVKEPEKKKRSSNYSVIFRVVRTTDSKALAQNRQDLRLQIFHWTKLYNQVLQLWCIFCYHRSARPK